ncbi:MAG: SMP-30/gluconolactonase/LRE family protein [Prochlorococcus sp.]|jgi:sugar lactone lactonase YvrE|tara:strand:- start:166 stop:1080 length:915 start_codon:yes stop_codon:yes gene_type:complete
MIEIECLWECNDGLGESPMYEQEEDALYWCDHAGPSMAQAGDHTPAIRRFNLSTGERTSWKMPEQVGSFAFRSGGGLIAATNSGFCDVDLENGLLARIVDPEPDNPHSRLNDGKIDRLGRYWCGSMDTKLEDPTSSIYRLDPDGSVHACASDFHFVCSNGIAFSPDDKLMYFGDTKAGMVYVFDFHLNDGYIDNRREFYSVKDNHKGIVDGATVDAEGYYWFALNMGGKIVRLDPKGRLDREIKMPIISPTCITFGGSDYDTLFVTSQQSFVTPEQMLKHPKPGSIFAIYNLGIRGLPEPTFGT